MTLVARKRVFIALAIYSYVALAAFAFCVVLLSVEGSAVEAGEQYASIFGVPVSSLVSVTAAVGLVAIFAAFTLTTLSRAYRKTVSHEIFFAAFWIAALSAEALRPLFYAFGFLWGQLAWHTPLYKLVLFARYFGSISLFLAGLYASGFRNEKTGAALFLAAAAAFGLSSNMPVNTGSFLPTLMPEPVHAWLLTGFVVTAALLTVLNFSVAAVVKKEFAFAKASAAVAAMSAGYLALIMSWQPVALALGAAAICAGTWLMLSTLHRYYLWQ